MMGWQPVAVPIPTKAKERTGFTGIDVFVIFIKWFGGYNMTSSWKMRY
jgi:hypothetical protein